MAMAAVGVQVATRPRFERLVGVGRDSDLALLRNRGSVERRQELVAAAGPADVARLRQRDELVASVQARTVQLLGQECERIFGLIAVARHALAAAMILP